MKIKYYTCVDVRAGANSAGCDVSAGVTKRPNSDFEPRTIFAERQYQYFIDM